MNFQFKEQIVSYYINPRYRGPGRALELKDLERDHVIPSYHQALIKACQEEKRHKFSPPPESSLADPCTKLSVLFPDEKNGKS